MSEQKQQIMEHLFSKWINTEFTSLITKSSMVK